MLADRNAFISHDRILYWLESISILLCGSSREAKLRGQAEAATQCVDQFPAKMLG